MAYRADEDGRIDEESEFIFTKLLELKLPERGMEHGYNVTVTAEPSVPDLAWDFGLSDLMTPGITDSFGAITGTFSKGQQYKLTVRVDNGVESAEMGVLLPKAFANFHLSGTANGGARFGGFSTSTDDQPKFEVDYPAYFYGGIVVGGIEYRAGQIAIPGNISGSTIVTRTGFAFAEPFPDGYGVFVTLTPQFGNNVIFGSVNFGTLDVTGSGFSVRVANNSTTRIGQDIAASYIAIGIPGSAAAMLSDD